MTIKIKFTKAPVKNVDTAVFCVYDDMKLSTAVNKELNKESVALIKDAVGHDQNFKGKTGQTLCVMLPKASGYNRAVLVGLGDVKAQYPIKTEEAGGKLCAALKSCGAEKVNVFAEGEKFAAHLANGVNLRGYNFDKYKSKKTDDKKPLSSVTVVSAQGAEFAALSHTTEGVFFARDLVNEAPNVLYPDAYAKIIKKELTPLGVKVEILDEKKMQALGFGALLAVGMGSARKPRMVVMHWNGGKAKDAPLALVGKGVTFDTGGISLKPGANMDEMKMDMGGSAAVVGTMKAIASRKSKANVIGIVGLVENMPSDCAYRPGDILTSYAGKTIEVLNTDAEGRLVLSDCLTYVQRKYKPKAIVDLATLTGAMMVALGYEYCGTFVTDDKFWSQLEKSSAATGENLWRMPLDKEWMKEMESDVADLKNLGSSRWAGACTAAGFLQHFIEGETPWAHMDIAGTAWRVKDNATTPKYGTGFGVRVLDRLIADNFE